MGVTSKENDVLWMTSDTWQLCIWNMIKRVGGSKIPGNGSIIEINFSMNIIIELDIFHYGSESNGIEYIRFLFGVETYDSGIASSFKVKDSFITILEKCTSSNAHHLLSVISSRHEQVLFFQMLLFQRSNSHLYVSRLQ